MTWSSARAGRSESLLGNIGLGVISRAGPALVTVLIGMTMARLLPAETLGQAYAAHAFAGLASVAACGWLYHVALREAAMPGWMHATRRPVRRGFAWSALGMVVLVFALQALSPVRSNGALLLLAGCAVAIGASEYHVALLRNALGLASAAAFSLFRALVALGIVVALILAGAGRFALALGFAIGGIVAMLWASMWPALRRLRRADVVDRGDAPAPTLAGWLAFGLPAAGAQLIALATDGGIRVALGSGDRAADAGVYGLSSDLVTLVVWGIGSTLVVVLMPMVGRLADTRASARQEAGMLIQVSTALAAVALIAATPLLAKVLAPSHLLPGVVGALPWVAAGVGLITMRHFGVEFSNYSGGTGRGMFLSAAVTFAVVAGLLWIGWADDARMAAISLTIGAMSGMAVSLSMALRGPAEVPWAISVSVSLAVVAAAAIVGHAGWGSTLVVHAMLTAGLGWAGIRWFRRISAQLGSG